MIEFKYNKMLTRLTIAVAAFIGAAFGPSSVFSQVVLDTPRPLQGVDIVEHLGETIDLGLSFFDESGAPVHLEDYFAEGRPVLLILGYYECPMLCNLVFNGTASGVRNMGWTPGDKFQIVTVSIDPGEGSELARAKKGNYLKSLGLADDHQGWRFLVGDASNIKQLADAVGFQFVYDEDTDEFAHAAVVTVLTDEGKISRYLYGVQFLAKDLKLALLEASEGKIGSTLERILLYCYRYDPDSKSYAMVAVNVMKLGGLVTVLGLGIFLGVMWFRERKRRHVPSVMQ